MFKNLITTLKGIVSLNVFMDHGLGVSDLILPDIFPEPGVLLNRDGSLQMSMIYSGADFESTTLAELRYINSMLYSNGFSRFGDEWVMHLTCLHHKGNNYIDESQCFFDAATPKLLDDERRYDFMNDKDHYINSFVLTLTYIPPGNLHTSIKNWFMDNVDTSKEKSRDEHVTYFKEIVSEFRATISSYVYTEIILDEEVQSYLYRMINGYKRKLQPARGAYLPLYYRLATQELIKGIVPKIGDLNIGIVSVGEGLPVHAWPGYTHELSTLEFEYAWVTRFIFSSKEQSKRKINDTADFHYQSQSDAKKSLHKKMTGFERINRSAGTFADQAEDALEALDTAGRAYGDYSCSVVIFDEDEDRLAENLSQVQKVIAKLGFEAKREKVNCLDAYFASIPGNRLANVRKWQMDTINLADLMPTTDAWHGYEKNPCVYYEDNNPPLFYAVAEGDTIFSGCTFVGDLGHAFIAGASRGGKSVWVNFLAVQHFRYKLANCVHFDNGYSGMPLCYSMNGSHYDIASESAQINFKPLQLLDGGQEDFTFLVNWLSNMAEVNLNRVLTSQERSEINDVLSLIKNQSTPEQKTITYFHYLLSSRAANSDLARAYVEYTTRGGKNSLKSMIFNATKDKLNLSRFTMFELEKLLKLNKDIVVPTIEYILHMTYKRLDGSPTLIVFEEIATIFKEPILQEIAENWLRNIGKKNAWLLLCTQQVQDILKSPIGDVILDQCKTKVFLPNSSLTHNDKAYEAYQQMGLNDKQISLIASAVPQREYFIHNSYGSRLINLRLSVTALAILAKNSQDELKIARVMKAKHANLFTYYWLKHWSLNDAAEYWLKLDNEFRGTSVKL
jgi:type IV secretion system protein VirB4